MGLVLFGLDNILKRRKRSLFVFCVYLCEMFEGDGAQTLYFQSFGYIFFFFFLFVFVICPILLLQLLKT